MGSGCPYAVKNHKRHPSSSLGFPSVWSRHLQPQFPQRVATSSPQTSHLAAPRVSRHPPSHLSPQSSSRIKALRRIHPPGEKAKARFSSSSATRHTGPSSASREKAEQTRSPRGETEGTPQEEAAFTKLTFIKPGAWGDGDPGDTEDLTPSCQRGRCQKATPGGLRGPPAPHHLHRGKGSAAGDPSPPQYAVARLQLEPPLALLKAFMTFPRLKYGPSPRTGRRRRAPANSLI